MSSSSSAQTEETFTCRKAPRGNQLTLDGLSSLFAYVITAIYLVGGVA